MDGEGTTEKKMYIRQPTSWELIAKRVPKPPIEQLQRRIVNARNKTVYLMRKEGYALDETIKSALSPVPKDLQYTAQRARLEASIIEAYASKLSSPIKEPMQKIADAYQQFLVLYEKLQVV